MSRFWQALEAILGPAGVGAMWQRHVGDEFARIKAAFLQATAKPAVSFPCERDCGCAHEVVRHEDGRIVGICRCDPWNCEDIPLTDEALIVYGLSWVKLGRAIARALGCDLKNDDFGLAATRQVAAFGNAALPIVLTIQHERREFRSVLAELAARLRSGFVLLAPTNRFIDANAKELLANAKAGFFDLASHLTLLPSGALQAQQKGGQLFAPYLPQPEPGASEAEAMRVFELMKRLDAGAKVRKAPLERVFRLLVLEGHSQENAARQCRCAPSLISSRVGEIEKRMGLSLANLKTLASRLGEMASVEDSRARSIYQRGLTDDTAEEDG
jgi:hypothetical protein